MGQSKGRVREKGGGFDKITVYELYELVSYKQRMYSDNSLHYSPKLFLDPPYTPFIPS